MQLHAGIAARFALTGWKPYTRQFLPGDYVFSQRSPVQAFGEFLKSLGPGRIIAMGAVTIALVAFFAFLILRVTAPAMTPLFTDLSAEDSAAIIKDLERQGISYEIRNEGATILVPKDRVTRLRMKLAEGGLPK